MDDNLDFKDYDIIWKKRHQWTQNISFKGIKKYYNTCTIYRFYVVTYL